MARLEIELSSALLGQLVAADDEPVSCFLATSSDPVTAVAAQYSGELYRVIQALEAAGLHVTGESAAAAVVQLVHERDRRQREIEQVLGALAQAPDELTRMPERIGVSRSLGTRVRDVIDVAQQRMVTMQESQRQLEPLAARIETLERKLASARTELRQGK
jgi:DNA repair ATPase RecN